MDVKDTDDWLSRATTPWWADSVDIRVANASGTALWVRPSARDHYEYRLNMILDLIRNVTRCYPEIDYKGFTALSTCFGALTARGEIGVDSASEKPFLIVSQRALDVAAKEVNEILDRRVTT